MTVRTATYAALLLLTSLIAGCPVPQPRGHGKVMHLNEPTTKRGYWLYLPDEYVKNDGRRPDGRKWPMVVTFHGMKPFDNAAPQIREWQEEADRYGYVVVAPELKACDMMKEFPIRTRSATLLSDEEATIRIMDDVLRRTEADANNVLSTSWSSGGFLAHYMVNQYPERFSCLATRQSNFSASLMDPRQAAVYRDLPIGLYYASRDFKSCKKHTLEAYFWYRRLGFTHVQSGRVQALGHERTPEVAASFFAEACGAKPKTPPTKLARIRLDEPPSEDLALVDSRTATPVRPIPRPASQSPPPGVSNYGDSGTLPRGNTRSSIFGSGTTTQRHPESFSTSGISTPTNSTPAYSSSPENRAPAANNGFQIATGGETAPPPRPRETPRPVYTPPPQPRNAAQPTPQRPRATRRTATSSVPVSVEVSSTVGISPLLVNFAVRLPPEYLRGADILWTDNGMPIGNGPSGQKVLTHAGEHKLKVLVITQDDQELQAETTVTVLAPLTQRTAGARR